MKKMINKEHIEGRIYQHNLIKKTVQNKASANFGKEFISGTIEVAVDENGLSIIPVHFTYVVEITNSGNKNATYSSLNKIINEGKTWILNGKDEATKVSIDTALALNDFYSQDNRLISAKVNEGGFVSILNTELAPENERNTFSADMLITSVVRVDANPDNNIDKDYIIIKGAIFNFRNAILPMDFIVTNPEGMEYFESLDISKNNPIFTTVWGKINCGSIENEIVEESAFGEESVRTYKRKVKEWIVKGASKVPHDFGDETVLTIEEVNKAMQDRELLLAEIKKRNDDYKNKKEENNNSLLEKNILSSTIKESSEIKKETFNF